MKQPQQIKKRPPVWTLLAWAFLIFFTSCFFISSDAWIAVIKRVVPIPLIQGLFGMFWYRWGFYVVKGWHATEYAILTSLLFLTLRSRLTRRPALALSLFLAVLFAASDEWHQTFVPGRIGCLRDVVIDTGGATLAIIIWAVKTRHAATVDIS